MAAAAVLDVPVRVAHDDAHDATDAQVDLGLGRLSSRVGVEPAMEYLLRWSTASKTAWAGASKDRSIRSVVVSVTFGLSPASQRSIIHPPAGISPAPAPGHRGQQFLQRHNCDVSNHEARP